MSQPLSVVIRCSDDDRVFMTIKSIDFPCEIIVALTQNEKLKKKLATLTHIRIADAPKKNLSMTANRGITAATNDNVFILDCDTVLMPGCLDKVAQALSQHSLVKTRIIFKSDTSLLSTVVANMRDYFNSDPTKAYLPGLGFKKSIIQQKLGSFFNKKIRSAEDSDFSSRLMAAGIPLICLAEALIVHEPISVRHDMAGAFLIGMGKYQGVEEGTRSYKPITEIILGFLTGRNLGARYDVYKKKGIKIFIYLFFWKLFYHFGYYSTHFKCQKQAEAFMWRMLGRP